MEGFVRLKTAVLDVCCVVWFNGSLKVSGWKFEGPFPTMLSCWREGKRDSGESIDGGINDRSLDRRVIAKGDDDGFDGGREDTEVEEEC
jgi:hypothetical protein